MSDFPIDFVVTWVDGSDPTWIAEKNKYSIEAGTKKKSMSSKRAFREWGTFKYWFRSVEKFAPWVRKIYVVTSGQIPPFLDLNYDKVRLITHKEIIDNQYLPTFNSNAIEANVNKIPGLSEHFVEFNDDMYLTSLVRPTDFFSDEGLPVYNTGISPIVPARYGTAHFQVNDMEIVNSHFTRDDIIRNGKLLNFKHGLKNVVRSYLYIHSKYVYGFVENHMPYPFLKSTIDLIWEKESEALKKTSSNKFRNASDTNLWLFKYWQIASGNYEPGKKDGKLVTLDDAGPKLWQEINSGKYKVMCLNDGFEVENEEAVGNDFIKAMEQLLPEKSSFEK